MKEEKVEYLLKYFSSLMNKNEAKAWKHSIYQYKLDNRINLDPKSKVNFRKAYLEKGLITEDPDVLLLLKNGIKQFELTTAQRILNDNTEVIHFNYCPKCNELARTPKAKQCRFCEHTWH